MLPTMRSKFIKRCLDVILALVGLVLTLPILLVLALLVRWRLGKPVLFRQERPGLAGRPFTIYKFRTMLDAADSDGRQRSDGERLTTFGRRLRATSLDELPELFNVLKGDMSIVGPRPLLMEYVSLYDSFQARRHEVRPGLTGWAQINGRNAIDWPTRFELDVWYIDNWSLWLDLRILAMTAVKVVRREGVSQPGRDTVDYFHGNKKEGPS